MSQEESLLMPISEEGRFFNRGMISVTIAQFFSALADNALLFAILVLAAQLKFESWVEPIFQLLFVGIYLISAPFVGSFADNYDKGRVMLLSNALKMAGALLILLGITPFIGYTIVGLGAALYSPAKYGILSELVSRDKLVKANGLIESSTLLAIILGAILGGFVADRHLTGALGLCVVIYGIAFISNLFIPKLKGEGKLNLSPKAQLRQFFIDFAVLYRNKISLLSLIGSGLFWGAGITLRFLMIAWVPLVLGLSDKTTPSLLNAAVAIGIVMGSIIASQWIPLERIIVALFSGVLMGIVVVVIMLLDFDALVANIAINDIGFLEIHQSLIPVYALLIFIGILGGMFIVPINARFQATGKNLVGVGKAVAVQNFTENFSMLVMLALFTILSRIGVPVTILGIGFGTLLSLAMGIVTLAYMRTKSKSNIKDEMIAPS